MASSCIADSDAAVLDLPGLDVASEAFAAETAELPSSLFAGSLEELAYTYVSSVAFPPHPLTEDLFHPAPDSEHCSSLHHG